MDNLRDLLKAQEIRLFHRSQYPFDLDSNGSSFLLSSKDCSRSNWLGRECKVLLEEALEEVRAGEFPDKPSR